MVELEKLFESLATPVQGADEGLRFEAVAVPDWPAYHVGRAANGDPALLIEARAAVAEPPAPMRLHALDVFHQARCRVTFMGRIAERAFTVLQLKNASEDLRRYFLALAAPMIVALGQAPDTASISRAVRGLVELFRSLGRPPRKTTQGLWAELLVLDRASDPLTLTRAWHVTPQDRYDFNSGSSRIEVKCASGGVRRHHFALEQLTPPAGTTVIIASCLTTRAAAGTSLWDVMRRVQGRLAGAAEMQSYVYQVLADSLGTHLQEGLKDAFDEELAVSSLWWIDSQAIPRVGTPVPSQVSDVHFTVDVGGLPNMRPQELASLGGLFAAAA